MSKGKGIGIAVAVIALAIVFGIASIPDEVLLESPNVDTSEIENTNIPIPVLDAPVEPTPEEILIEVVEDPVEPTPEEILIEVVEDPVEPTPEETPIIVEEPIETIPVESEPEESNRNGQVIRVGIKDGIGSRDR